MPTTGVINGTLLRIYKGGTAIGYATNCTLSVSREIREILTKDSPGSGWREIAPGRKSGTMSTEALYSEDTSNISPADLFDDLNNGTEVSLFFTTDVAGDTYYSCSAYCTSIEFNAAVEENVSFSATFEIDGAITKGTET